MRDYKPEALSSVNADVVCRQSLAKFDLDEPIFFCPMGMAVFDIAIAFYYMKLAKERGLGVELE